VDFRFLGGIVVEETWAPGQTILRINAVYGGGGRSAIVRQRSSHNPILK
jgi:hypothetical protein